MQCKIRQDYSKNLVSALKIMRVDGCVYFVSTWGIKGICYTHPWVDPPISKWDLPSNSLLAATPAGKALLTGRISEFPVNNENKAIHESGDTGT